MTIVCNFLLVVVYFFLDLESGNQVELNWIEEDRHIA